MQMTKIQPGRIVLEVFSGLVLLSLLGRLLPSDVSRGSTWVGVALELLLLLALLWPSARGFTYACAVSRRR